MLYHVLLSACRLPEGRLLRFQIFKDQIKFFIEAASLEAAWVRNLDWFDEIPFVGFHGDAAGVLVVAFHFFRHRVTNPLYPCPFLFTLAVLNNSAYCAFLLGVPVVKLHDVR
nr:MAG TPA: hypothetical protein [Caudoviricetes sp.]